jgi:hypothetical protein
METQQCEFHLGLTGNTTMYVSGFSGNTNLLRNIHGENKSNAVSLWITVYVDELSVLQYSQSVCEYSVCRSVECITVYCEYVDI